MNGLELLRELNPRAILIPMIFITEHGYVPLAADALRIGALDFMRKPIREQDLLDEIQQALSYDAGERCSRATTEQLKGQIASLTPKEIEIFKRVAQGQVNKVIALDPGVSEWTVEVHWAYIMQKLSVRSLAELVRINLLLAEQLGINCIMRESLHSQQMLDQMGIMRLSITPD